MSRLRKVTARAGPGARAHYAQHIIGYGLLAAALVCVAVGYATMHEQATGDPPGTTTSVPKQ
jgi:hypothetical protein